MRTVTTIAFWLCIVCVVLGATIGVVWIWGVGGQFPLYESLMSVVIVFLASACVLAVASTYLGRPNGAK